MYVIRKRIKVAPEQAVFMFVKNVLPPTGERRWMEMERRVRAGRAFSPAGRCACARTILSFLTQTPFIPHPFFSAALMSDVYDDHKDQDGFLYMTFAGENTFG